MSKSTEKPPRRVGRGYPPEEHRWKPGQSGNPCGRTPGALNQAKIPVATTAMTQGDRAAIKEAYRTVTSSEGESLATIEAMHRARNISAMKGNRLAAKDADSRLAQAEEKAQRQKEEAFQQALEYQSTVECYLRIALERGISDPGFYPLPEDIRLDYETLSVTIEGPRSVMEAREWSDMLKEIEWSRQRVLWWRRRVERSSNDEMAQYMLIKCTDTFLTSNKCLPERYRLSRLPAWPAGRMLPWPDAWERQWSASTSKRKLRRAAELEKA